MTSRIPRRASSPQIPSQEDPHEGHQAVVLEAHGSAERTPRPPPHLTVIPSRSRDADASKPTSQGAGRWDRTDMHSAIGGELNKKHPPAVTSKPKPRRTDPTIRNIFPLITGLQVYDRWSHAPTRRTQPRETTMPSPADARDDSGLTQEGATMLPSLPTRRFSGSLSRSRAGLCPVVSRGPLFPRIVEDVRDAAGRGGSQIHILSVYVNTAPI